MLGLEVGIRRQDQRPCLCCSSLLHRPAGLVRAGGAVRSPFPHPVPPLLGHSTPRVQADVLMRSSLSPAYPGNYCLPAGGPAAVPGSKGCEVSSWWEEVWPKGNTEAILGSFCGPL